MTENFKSDRKETLSKRKKVIYSEEEDSDEILNKKLKKK
jgi:hypothetical protein